MVQEGDNIRTIIKQLKKDIKVAAQTLDRTTRTIGELEPILTNLFQTKWDEIFPGISVRFLTGLQGGCHCADWRPEIFVYHINDCITFPDGRWAKESDSGKYYANRTTFIPCPVSEDKLAAFLISFRKETGVSVKLPKEKLQTADNLERLSSVEDLRCKYGEFEVVEEGNIWYVGWDIPDPFVVGQFKDGHREIWYSTNGHGFGFDVMVGRGETAELDTFYECMEDNKVEIKTTKEQVLESWGK